MATITGGPEDNQFQLSSADGSASVDGGAGFDTLLVDWSDKTFSVRGQFDVRFGAPNAYLDDYLGGAQIDVVRVEKLVVKFGRGNDQFNLSDTVIAELDGGAGVDSFHGNFQNLTSGIAFALKEAAGAVSVLQGQGSSISGYERVSLFTGVGDDDLAGGSLADVFSVGGGNNRVSGGAGDDQVLSGGGVNTVLGGEGNDRWIGNYDGASALQLVQTGLASYALSDGSTVDGVETVELALTSGADTIELKLGVRELTVNAGDGEDTATIDWSELSSAALGSLTGAPGSLQLSAGAGGPRIVLNQIEALTVALGSADDSFYLTGDMAATLDGGAGTDFFYGDFRSSPLFNALCRWRYDRWRYGVGRRSKPSRFRQG